MASKAEATFGARLNNAEKMITYLESFPTYNPQNAELSITNLKALVQEIKTTNDTTAGNAQVYGAAVEVRQKIFQKDPDSVKKIMTPLLAAARSAFGKDSKDAAMIRSLVVTIRGVRVKKGAKNPTEEAVSQSAMSFGSITKSFADIISTLEKYGTDYAPANDDIKIQTLKGKLPLLTQVNEKVTAAYGKLKEVRDDRVELYKTLSELSLRVKDAVKSQYKMNSSEYKLVKGLKI